MHFLPFISIYLQQKTQSWQVKEDIRLDTSTQDLKPFDTSPQPILE
jgi:hypothetical protein